MPLYIEKVEIRSGVIDALLTDSLTALVDSSATQLLISIRVELS